MSNKDPVAKAFYNLNATGKPHSWANLDEFRKDIKDLLDKDPDGEIHSFNDLELTLKKGETVYNKDTIRLATPEEIARNRVNNKLVTMKAGDKEVTQPLVVWCEQLNRDYNTVQLRLQRGWTQQRALTIRTNKPYTPKIQAPYKKKKTITLPPCE